MINTTFLLGVAVGIVIGAAVVLLLAAFVASGE